MMKEDNTYFKAYCKYNNLRVSDFRVNEEGLKLRKKLVNDLLASDSNFREFYELFMKCDGKLCNLGKRKDTQEFYYKYLLARKFLNITKPSGYTNRIMTREIFEDVKSTIEQAEKCGRDFEIFTKYFKFPHTQLK